MDKRMTAAKSVATSLLLLFTCLVAFAQNSEPKKEKIEILNSDEVNIERDKVTGKDWYRLLGNVSLLHNEMTMLCDSAHFYPDKNSVNAYHNIHIEQGDTLHMYGNILTYEGTTEIAEMTGNVVLINKETFLYTNHGTYNLKTKIANYTDSGRIVNKENILKSKRGIYYAAEDMIFFKDNVEITTPEYYITSDTMQYNTESEIVFFRGPTNMEGDSLLAFCEQGWYDTKNDIGAMSGDAMINNLKQIVRGDSIFYNDSIGQGKSFGNISITDTTQKIMVKGNYAWFNKEPEQFLVTDNAFLVQFSNNDSLFLRADTLRSVTAGDTINPFRLMSAYYNCKIFRQDLQAKCDSMAYSFQDSVIRLYTAPIIWSDENQLTADSIALFTKNMEPDRLELYNSAFVVSQVDSLRYNQIKGRDLTGYFQDNELTRIYINGNGETIYYLIDGDALIGVNKATSSTIEMLFEEGKIKDIFQYEPGGDIDPPLDIYDPSLHLDGFSWFDEQRPKSVEDIFKK